MAELVEGARLESGYMGNCVVGSNPTLSAIKEYLSKPHNQAFYFTFKYGLSFLYLYVHGIISLIVLDGGVAVPCNLQSAIAGFNSFDKGRAIGVSPCFRCDEFLVLRNGTLRTVSDPDGSSTKEFVFVCREVAENEHWSTGNVRGLRFESKVHDLYNIRWLLNHLFWYSFRR